MRSGTIGVTNWRRRGVILTAAIAIVVAALAMVSPASLARPSMSTEVRSVIARDIDPMAAASGAGGVAVAVRMNGRTLFFNYGYADQVEKRPITSDELFNVGSVRKVFSVGQLLNQIGPTYRYNTPVYRRGELSGAGVLHGDLVLVASGDLTMGGRTNANGTIARSVWIQWP